MSRFEISRFKEAPDDEFVCGICKNVLDEPKESPCRHVFCKVCITRALKEKSKCPICRTSFRERHLKNVLPLVQNLLNKLPMECDHFENGCLPPIPLELYINHTATCDYMMVTCKNTSCHERFLKKDCADHETNLCQYRTFVCDKGCQCEVFYPSKDTHNCIDTLIQTKKDALEKIEKLEQRVKELEAADKSNNRRRRRSGSDSDDEDDYFPEPYNPRSPSPFQDSDDDAGSPLTRSPFSYHDYDYSISSVSDIEPFNGGGGSPSVSLSMGSPVGSDCSDDDMAASVRSIGSARSVGSAGSVLSNNNGGNNDNLEIQEEFIPMSDVDFEAADDDAGANRNIASGGGGGGGGDSRSSDNENNNHDYFYNALRHLQQSSSSSSSSSDEAFSIAAIKARYDINANTPIDVETLNSSQDISAIASTSTISAIASTSTISAIASTSTISAIASTSSTSSKRVAREEQTANYTSTPKRARLVPQQSSTLLHFGFSVAGGSSTSTLSTSSISDDVNIDTLPSSSSRTAGIGCSSSRASVGDCSGGGDDDEESESQTATATTIREHLDQSSTTNTSFIEIESEETVSNRSHDTTITTSTTTAINHNDNSISNASVGRERRRTRGRNGVSDSSTSVPQPRRSARLRNVPPSPVAPEEEELDLYVPPSASLLLDVYANQDNSSSDESWSPGSASQC